MNLLNYKLWIYFSLKKKNSFIVLSIILISIGAICMLPLRSTAQNDTKAFGDSIFVRDGLMGKIFLLPATTRKLPERKVS